MNHSKTLKTAAIILSASILVLSGCKKETQDTDLSSVYTTAAQSETMSSTTSAVVTTTAPSKGSDSENVANSDTEKDSISTEAETYTNKDVKISYPTISGMTDTEKQVKVNDLIKKNAISVISANGIDESNTTVDISYKVISADRKRITITYSGYYNSSSMAYPANIFYSNTVDLNTVSDLGLNDFSDAYTMAGYILSDDVTLSGANTDITAAFMDSRSDSTLDSYTETLNSADFPLSTGIDGNISGWPESFSYEKDGDIYFTIPVIHALGDYVTVKFSPSTK